VYAPLQSGARIALPAEAPSWAGLVGAYFSYFLFLFFFLVFEKINFKF
jgi:hypothetical protein